MKRRTFLTAASTIGIIGAASSATLASSVYTNISTSVLLEEFDTPSKIVLDKFVSDITENAESLGLDTSLAKRMAMPTQILSKESTRGNQNITFRNRTGQLIQLTFKNGTGRILILPSI